jgi:hypothetical protein
MFVHPSRLATQGAVLVGTLALVACEDPEARTDLRPAGDPEVLSVLVMNDAAGGLIETATFCKTGDVKRPTLVGLPDFTTTQVCADDVSMPATEVEDAVPTGWFARVMFDELLDPDVEDLIPILDPDTMQETGTFSGSLAQTQPLTLTCGGNAVQYDGYYNPSGNNVTWPLGPSLFFAPTDPTTVATGSECEVGIKESVTDKDGNLVPDTQRSGYKFKIAPLTFLGSTPAPAEDPAAPETISADAPVVVTTNAFINATTLEGAEVTITELTAADCTTTAGTAIAAANIVIADDGDGSSIDIGLAAAASGSADLLWKPDKAYLLTFAAGNEVTDLAGGKGSFPTDLNLCFTTVAP